MHLETFLPGVSAISGTTYSCAGTTQTVGCTTTTGTNTCYCNTDLCNKSGGIRSQNVDGGLTGKDKNHHHAEPEEEEKPLNA